jgi:hypothetical protein
MPKNKFFEGDQQILKAKLWNTMTNVIADQALTEGKIAQIDQALFDDPQY